MHFRRLPKGVLIYGGGSLKVNNIRKNSEGATDYEDATIGDYYIGYVGQGVDGWRCTGGNIMYSAYYNDGYGGHNICVVEATDSKLGLMYHQNGGSRVWLYPALIHLSL